MSNVLDSSVNLILDVFLLFPALWFVIFFFFFSYALTLKQISCFGNRADVCQKTEKKRNKNLNSIFGFEARELFLCVVFSLEGYLFQFCC